MNDTIIDGELLFSFEFPLPYRVLVLAGLGILGWATNLHGLQLLGVDVVAAMDLRTEGYQPRLPLPSTRMDGFKHFADPSVLYGAAYRIFAIYTMWCLASWSFFRYATWGDIQLADAFGYIPGITALSVMAILICPINVLHKSERDKFLYTLRRCLFSSMDSPVYFADVVFADVLTSFAKVMADAWLSIHMLLPGHSLLTTPTDEGTWLRWIFPIIMSLPYLIRFRQCVIEYSLPSNESRRPLWNALKYATSFPVIYLSSVQQIVVKELVKENGNAAAGESWHGEHRLFRLWLLAAAINSLYSFWWDVTNDWGLEMLRPHSSIETRARPLPPKRLVLPHLHSGSPLLGALDESSADDTSSHEDLPHRMKLNASQQGKPAPYGLRATMFYPVSVYPVLIVLNFLLRVSWLIRFSTHIHLKTDGGLSTFWLELAEIVRRWLWVFIRVEWEVIKKAQEGVPRGVSGGGLPDEISGDEASDYELISSPSRATMD